MTIMRASAWMILEHSLAFDIAFIGQPAMLKFALAAWLELQTSVPCLDFSFRRGFFVSCECLPS
jgi:hypothetical protein